MDNTIDMRVMNVAKAANPAGWMRNASFDLLFIVGVAALALLTGWLSVANPALFPLLLILNVWILGYHHVIATFTRLVFDVESLRQHKFLGTWLPVIVAVAVVLAVLSVGPWLLATTYLYWQWFHYTRQSYGISRIYYRKGNPALAGNNLLEQAAVYAVPTLGILYRSWQHPPKFLGVELKVVPVPFWLVRAAAIASVVIVVAWAINQVLAYRKGEVKPAYTLFMLSHLGVFFTAYILIDEINYGWLCLNVWHNTQYVMLVWVYNNNRFRDGVDPRHKFLSTISQRQNVLIYYAVCLGISTIIYAAFAKMLGVFSVTALPLALMFYHTINYHHYIVDGIIWKLRQKSVGRTLGVAN